MRKSIAKTLCILFALMLLVSTQLSASDIGVRIDGVLVVFAGQGPVNIDGRTMVPLRGVFEQLGFDVEWDQAAQTATLTNDDFEIIIAIGSSRFTINGETYVMDVPAQVVDGRILLPIRVVLEGAGYYVRWSNSANAVVIYTPVIAQNDEPTSIPVPTPTPVPLQGGRNVFTVQQAAATYVPTSMPSPTPPPPAQAPPASGVSDFELRVFELVNIERENRGLPPLIWSNTLANAARAHSVDIARNNITSHIGSDGSSVPERLSREGIEHVGWSENISFGSRTAEAAMASWMSSPAHRTNILNPSSTHLGVGFHHRPDSQWTYYATKKFVIAP